MDSHPLWAPRGRALRPEVGHSLPFCTLIASPLILLSPEAASPPFFDRLD